MITDDNNNVNKKYSNCPFCSNSEIVSSKFEDTFFNNKTFSYVKCKKCKLIFVQPFPTDEDYDVMYSPKYQDGTINEMDYFIGHNKIIELINTYTTKKKLLDYGCGNGSFLAYAAEKNFECYGVEFSSLLIEPLKKNIKNVNFQTVEEFEKSKSTFDIIHINNVLEHIANPNKLMQKLKLHLSDDGIFIVFGPIENNLNFALVFRKIFFFTRKIIFKKVNSHAPNHVFYSNAKNQKMFFINQGINELFYQVKEKAWPFPFEFKRAKGFAQKSKFLIAKVSMGISSLNKKLGNNFIFIGNLKK